MGSLAVIYNLNQQNIDRKLLTKMSNASIQDTLDVRTHTQKNFGAIYNYSYSSLAEQQPYVNDEPSILMVLSGQLYYLKELIVKIRKIDPNINLDSQSAIICAAYTLWQEDFVDYLDGDFSLVLFDVNKNKLLCIRDPLGVKPLYFSQVGEIIYFASEQRQLLAAGINKTLSKESIAAYLSINHTLTGGSNTFYQNIHQIPAGHFLIAKNGHINIHKYWELDPNFTINTTDENEMVEHVRTAMYRSVAERIPEKAPYGCALSGGFDSSSIAGLYRKILDEKGINAPLDTFSFELRDDAADEHDLIISVAKHVNSHHRHIYVDKDNVFDVLPGMIKAMEHPTYDMGLLYLWRKKEEAAKHKVYTLLSGLGGDEIFMGRYYYFADLFRQGRWIELAKEVKSLYPIDTSTGKTTSLSFLLRAYLISPLVSDSIKNFIRKNFMGDNIIKPWIRHDLATQTDLKDKLLKGPHQLYSDAYRQEAYETFQYILVNITLPIHQSLGTAHSVDTRFPLLDKRLVEYMFATPREVKIKQGSSRMLQRKAMQDILPAVVTSEHLKKNVNPVLWQQQHGNLLKELEKLFSNPNLASYEYIDKHEVENIYSSFVNNTGSNISGYILWYVLNLETWLQIN